MNDDFKKLLPPADTIGRFAPLAFGAGLAFFFGMGWLIIPILLAFFFPSLFKIIYAVFLFMALGTFFTGCVFVIMIAFDTMPFSGESWWTIARWLYVPTGIISLYLAGDVDSFRNSG